jgi:hypothetical protein
MLPSAWPVLFSKLLQEDPEETELSRGTSSDAPTKRFGGKLLLVSLPRLTAG